MTNAKQKKHSTLGTTIKYIKNDFVQPKAYNQSRNTQQICSDVSAK